LPFAISNQVLRKYGNNKKCKRIKPERIKLVAPGKSIKINKNKITIISLKLTIVNQTEYTIIKVNQIELDHTYVYVCFEVNDEPLKKISNYIGVDLNAT